MKAVVVYLLLFLLIILSRKYHPAPWENTAHNKGELFQGDYVRILPLLIMGILTVSAGIASMFLPETLGIDLPQTLEEAEEFGKGFSPVRCFDRRRTSTALHELKNVETNNLLSASKCDNNGDAVPI